MPNAKFSVSLKVGKSVFPASLRGINQLPEPEKRAIYATLIPDWVFAQLGTRIEEFISVGHPNIILQYTAGSRAFELSVKRHPSERDPMVYLHMTDTFNNQILVLLVVMNDLDAPRFNIDVDQNGNKTQFGTASRNIPAELAAMQAGLAPGQVRQGRRSFRKIVPIFETFIRNMGHDIFFIEPLAYHNAIVFEQYGFSYLRGLQEMRRIHDQFLPGGEYYNNLGSDVFRPSDAWKSVRGRSWAIHDGILGHPFTGFQMYKRVGHHAGIETFPDYEW